MASRYFLIGKYALGSFIRSDIIMCVLLNKDYLGYRLIWIWNKVWPLRSELNLSR
jgi:hypothetical protein